MTTTTTDQQLTIPSNTDANDIVTMISSLIVGTAAVESRLVKRYLSSTDRTARNPTPAEGEFSYLLDVNELDSYDGAAWQQVWRAGAPRGIMATPISTTTDATLLSTPEAQDTNLGNYTFTGVTGRRYAPRLSNATMISGAAGDGYLIRLRDGGAGAPTNASTIVSETYAVTNVSNQPVPINQLPSFTVTSGVHTLGLFVLRYSGSNTATISSSGHQAGGTRGRELYVEDIGNL